MAQATAPVLDSTMRIGEMVAAQVVEDEARSAGPKRAGALPPVQRRAQTRAGQQGMSRDDASRA